VCECRTPAEQQTRDDLFIWRGDPTWWSCMSCDGRVRPLTKNELAQRNYQAAAMPRNNAPTKDPKHV
jgi:hypothetical protein